MEIHPQLNQKKRKLERRKLQLNPPWMTHAQGIDQQPE